MSLSGVTLSQEAISAHEAVKDRKLKYAVYKISDDNRQIVVEHTSTDPDWDDFVKSLTTHTTTNSRGDEIPLPRFGLYDVEYNLPGGAGKRNRLTFIAWSPDAAGVTLKFLYSTSKTALLNAFGSLAGNIQATDVDDLIFDDIVKEVHRY